MTEQQRNLRRNWFTFLSAFSAIFTCQHWKADPGSLPALLTPPGLEIRHDTQRVSQEVRKHTIYKKITGTLSANSQATKWLFPSAQLSHSSAQLAGLGSTFTTAQQRIVSGNSNIENNSVDTILDQAQTKQWKLLNWNCWKTVVCQCAMIRLKNFWKQWRSE